MGHNAWFMIKLTNKAVHKSATNDAKNGEFLYQKINWQKKCIAEKSKMNREKAREGEIRKTEEEKNKDK